MFILNSQWPGDVYANITNLISLFFSLTPVIRLCGYSGFPDQTQINKRLAPIHKPVYPSNLKK